MYKDLSSVYDKYGWNVFSNQIFNKLKPIIKTWDIKSHCDFACGTGDFVNNIHSLGIKSFGVDISKDMIKIAKNKYPNLKFFIGDIKTYQLKQPVDFISCLYNSINHLENFDEWELFFRNVFNSLKKGGYFFFDINTIAHMNNINVFDVKSDEDILFIKRIFTINNDSCVYSFEWFIKDNKNSYKRFKNILKEISFPYAKTSKLLKKIGFKKIDILFNTNKNPDISNKTFFLITK